MKRISVLENKLNFKTSEVQLLEEQVKSKDSDIIELKKMLTERDLQLRRIERRKLKNRINRFFHKENRGTFSNLLILLLYCIDFTEPLANG